MKKDISKKTRRAILKIRSSSSLRRYLPLTVRVHYDVVRNWRKAKVWGLGTMMLVAVFGVLLATQSIAPASSAIGGNVLPRLRVTQAGAMILAKPRAEGVTLSNYQYTFINSSTACNSSQFRLLHPLGVVSYSHGSSHRLTSNDRVGQKACFRAQSQGTQYWGYASRIVQRFTSPPRIKVKQNQKLVVATATAIDNEVVTGWQRVILQSNKSCTSNRFQSRAVKAGNTIVLTNNILVGQKACFRARYTTDANSWGYGSYIIKRADFSDTTAPSLQVNQNNRVITASAGRVAVKNWQNITISARAVCKNAFSSATTANSEALNYKTGSAIVLKNNNAVGRKACFRAQGSTSNLWGYTSLIIKRADFVKPVVLVEQNDALISASSPDDIQVSTWRFIIIPSSVSCFNSLFTHGNNVKFTGAGKSYTLLSDRYKGDKICFRVRTNVSLVWGLGEKIIESKSSQGTPGATPATSSDSTPASSVNTDSSNGSASTDSAATTNEESGAANTTTQETATSEDEVVLDEAETSQDAGKIEEVTDTGFADEGLNLPQLAGFILIAGAILGTARILLIKHHHKRQ